jgi:hypothetical protein
VAAADTSSHSGRSRTDPGAGRIPPASAGDIVEPVSSRPGPRRNEKRPRKLSAVAAEGGPQLKQAELIPSVAADVNVASLAEEPTV